MRSESAWAAVWFLTGLSACAADDGSDIAKPCAELSPQECPRATRCEVVAGTRFDTALECKDEGLPLGCRDESLQCANNHRTTVKGADGKTWLVRVEPDRPDCLPAGYTTASELGGPPPGETFEHWQSCAGPLAPPCGELPVAECDTPRCRFLGGRRIDLEGMCFRESARVGCVQSGTACGDSMTLARDPAGVVWEFGNTCTPRGWTSFDIELGGMFYSSLPDGWEKPCP